MGSKILLEDAKLTVAEIIAQNKLPGLVHAFEYSGFDAAAKTVTCGVTGVVLTYPSITDNTTGFTTIQTPTVTGTLIAPGTSDTVIISVMPVQKTDASVFVFGDDAAYGFDAASVAATNGYVATIGAATAYHTLPTLSISGANATNAACATTIDWVNNTTTSYTVDAGKTSVSSGAGVDAGAGITAGISQANLGQAIITPKDNTTITAGCYVFYFPNDGLPDDMKNIVAWMANNPGYISPSLFGRS